MIRPAYILLFSTIFCTLEILFRNAGIFFPFCALFVFYVSLTFGKAWGFFTAILGACALDFTVAGASHPWTILPFAGIILFSKYWLHREEADSVFMNFLPGLMIPFITWGSDVIFHSDHFTEALLETFPGVFPASVISAVILPCMICLLDALNEKTGLPLYTDARLKMKMKF